jgi:hypothetical protein
MIEKIQKLDYDIRCSVLITTLAIAIFMVVSINALMSVIYISKLIQQLDYESISFSFNDGYFVINNHEEGLSLFFNFIGIIGLWFFMVLHTIKVINKPVVY